jgi:diacylglycerol kinase family enzyme
LGGVCFPVDLGEVLLDGRLHLFVAHLVARSRLWTRAFVAMNAQWRGSWNLGPRAHPGDGLVDTYDVRLRPSQLLPVRSRLHHGAHLPHPGIEERRSPAVSIELDRPLPVELDGVAVGSARRVAVRVKPDALRVVV